MKAGMKQVARNVKNVDMAKTAQGPRPIGLAKGQFTIPDSFFDPMPEEELALWEAPLDCAGTLSTETLSEKRRRASLSRKTFSGGSGGSRPGAGGPRSTDRCPCGVMTRARAEARRHKC